MEYWERNRREEEEEKEEKIYGKGRELKNRRRGEYSIGYNNICIRYNSIIV